MRDGDPPPVSTMRVSRQDTAMLARTRHADFLDARRNRITCGAGIESWSTCRSPRSSLMMLIGTRAP